MANIENSTPETSSLRRWWSVAIGVIVFIGLLLVYQALLTRLFGPGGSDHLTSGSAILEVVGGFICGYVGAACGRLIARDMDKTTFRYSATAALVIVALILVAGISASPEGFTINTIIIVLALIVPGYIGLRAGTQ